LNNSIKGLVLSEGINHTKVSISSFLNMEKLFQAVSSFTTALELVNKQALNLNENTRKEFNKILVDCINKFSAKVILVKIK